MSISTLRSYEQTALQTQGSISVDEAKKLVASATTAEEKAVLRDMAAHDAFEPAARKIIEKAAGKLDEQPSSMVGTKLGTMKTGGMNVNVTITKELGPTAGYANRTQALGAARAAGVNNALVIADGSKPPRWHAVQTNISAAQMSPAKTGFGEVKVLKDPLPTATLDAMRKLAVDAKQVMMDNPGDPAVRAYAESAWVSLAAATYGVDPSEINLVPKNALKPDGINLELESAHGRAHFGNAKGDVEPLPQDKTTQRSPHGVVIGTSALGGQIEAGGILTHESTHKEHFDLATTWLQAWREAKTDKPFGRWLDSQKNAGKLTADQFDAIIEERDGKATAQTELSAYINELAVTFGRYDNPNATEAKMTFNAIKDRWGALGDDDKKTLKALYGSLDEDHRKVFVKYLGNP